MTKVQLVNYVVEKTGLSKEVVDQVYFGIVEGIKDGLIRDSEVKLRGFGNFYLKRKKAHGTRVCGTEDLKGLEFTRIHFRRSLPFMDEISKARGWETPRAARKANG